MGPRRLVADQPVCVMDSIADPVLRPFLSETEAVEAERLLADLVRTRVHPTVRDVARRVLRSRLPAGAASLTEDLEDVGSEAVLRVLHTLRELRTDGQREPVQNLDAYAARVATHACYEHFRRRQPGRARLRNQVWYVLSRDPSLTLERGPDGTWTCGLAASVIEPGPAPVFSRDGRSLRDLIRTTLRRHGAGMELNELVRDVGETRGVGDGPSTTRARALAANPELIPDPQARSPMSLLEHQEYLTALWAEVQQLPLRQRTALLLNLRDADGGDALDLFPLTGIASLRDIAGALGLDPVELARLWPELPLDDNRIASRLGVSRQQVINLRKAARARIARRLDPGGGRRRRAVR